MEKKLINLYPASCWNDTTPIGNGRIGASVYGCAYDERILINHEALFNYSSTKEIPDISDCLGKVRSLMDEKKYLEAENYYTNALLEKNYKTSKGKFYPAFDIHMIFGTKGAPYGYKRELDMENGVATILFGEDGDVWTRRAFVSSVDKYLFVQIKKGEPFNMIFALERHDVADDPNFRNCDTFESFSKDGCVYTHTVTEGRLDYSGIVKVLYTALGRRIRKHSNATFLKRNSLYLNENLSLSRLYIKIKSRFAVCKFGLDKGSFTKEVR